MEGLATKLLHDLHARNMLDVSRVVNFVIEHSNDSSIELSPPQSFISVIGKHLTKNRVGEDGNVGCETELDESVLFWYPPIFASNKRVISTHHFLKLK